MPFAGLPPTLDHRLEADPACAGRDEPSVMSIRASSRKRVERLTSRRKRANRDLSAKVGNPRLPALSHRTHRAGRRPSHDYRAVARRECFA